MADEVLYDIDGQVVVITLNRPNKHNALNAAMRDGLWKAWQDFEADETLRVAILTGAGDKAFCAGIDLAEFAETKLAAPPPNFLPVLGQNIRVSKPVIAAVNGFAYAGGWRLAQMCDLCIASEQARFAITEARVGRGATWAAPLVHMIPPRILLELLMTGNPISAQRAYDIGFVNHVVPAAELMARARLLADDIIAGAPLFITAAKELVARSIGVPEADALRTADRIFEPVYNSQDAIEGPLAFREKRKPNWRGR
jgi:enoyl-CoA hydratase/carnithine racemase